MSLQRRAHLKDTTVAVQSLPGNQSMSTHIAWGLHQGRADRHNIHEGGLQHHVILQAGLLAEGCADGWAQKAATPSRQWLQTCGSDGSTT